MSNPEVNDLTENENDDGKLIISSLNMHRLNYRQGSSGSSSGSDNRLRIPIPMKRRQFGCDEYPNFERQYIQNINIPTATSDNDGAAQIHDDNYHFLMSLLPYLREVPKNRKMVIRHKLQKVFVEEQERKSVGRNNNASNQNFPAPYSRVFKPDPPRHPAQTPRLPPPPYPMYKQDAVYNYVPSAASASASASATVPLQPNASASTSTLFADLIGQQQPSYPAPVSLPSGHQQLQQYYNATTTVNNNNNNNNNSFSSYKSTAVNNNNSSFSNFNATTVSNNNSFPRYNATTAVDNNDTTITYQSGVTEEPQTFTYLQ